MAKYERQVLSVFGRELLASGDLDPVYISIYRSRLPLVQQKRLLFSYWLFYHLGLATYLSSFEGEHFFKRTLELLPEAPRGTERRHFRGQKAADAVAWFRDHYLSPEQAVDNLITHSPTAAKGIEWQKRTWPQFGPWIAFKSLDMVERILGINIDFRGTDLMMYDTPVAGAKLWVELHGGKYRREDLPALLNIFLRMFRRYSAPPDFKRSVGIQEVETILCKWKSHRGGHYPVGNDTREVQEHLRHGYLGDAESDRMTAALQGGINDCRRIQTSARDSG